MDLLGRSGLSAMRHNRSRMEKTLAVMRGIEHRSSWDLKLWMLFGYQFEISDLRLYMHRPLPTPIPYRAIMIL